MKLIHYSSLFLECLIIKEYHQDALSWQAKPHGLWLSVDDEWKKWCEREKFKVEDLKHAYEVTLKNDANILYLKTPEEIFDFTKKYPLKTRDWDADWDTYQLDWKKVKNDYQGIIISPYQYPCRLALESSWYYGWDCASGCIWDLWNTIDKFEEIINENITCSS